MERVIKKGLISIDESNDKFASLNEKAREVQMISFKINELMDSFVQERQRRNLSQRDLADLLEWKQPALARMERLDSIPRLDTFLKALMKVGGNLFVEYFTDTIPVECTKSSSYVNHISSTTGVYNNTYSNL